MELLGSEAAGFVAFVPGASLIGAKARARLDPAWGVQLLSGPAEVWEWTQPTSPPPRPRLRALERMIARQPGIEAVEALGGTFEPRWRVEADPARLLRFGLSLEALIGALREGVPAREGPEDLILAAQPLPVRVRDVATCRLSPPPPPVGWLVRGKSPEALAAATTLLERAGFTRGPARERTGGTPPEWPPVAREPVRSLEPFPLPGEERVVVEVAEGVAPLAAFRFVQALQPWPAPRRADGAAPLSSTPRLRRALGDPRLLLELTALVAQQRVRLPERGSRSACEVRISGPRASLLQRPVTLLSSRLAAPGGRIADWFALGPGPSPQTIWWLRDGRARWVVSAKRLDAALEGVDSAPVRVVRAR